MKKTVLGILAHVDAGKTTLAEAILYSTGKSRSLGRVDKGDTNLDTHRLERERGITIFSSQAVFNIGNMEVCLLDTPGHIDFSAETERALQVLDYAILVISGLDGVQAHTRTLWRLLQFYNVPTFVFVTKMDFARNTQTELLSQLQKELDSACVDFSNKEARDEGLAMCSERLLDKYLSGEEITSEDAAGLILRRRAFPCYFGSGLKLEGIDSFLNGLETYTVSQNYPDVFGAKVFKITRDKSDRLTHLKITGGKLKVKDTVDFDGVPSKINQIRIYSGEKYVTVDEVEAGSICAVTGPGNTYNGQGIGYEANSEKPILEPVMNYRIVLPKDVDARTMLPKLKMLEEEDPQLHIGWNEYLQEINVSLMGEVQVEIFKSIVADKFSVDIEIDEGRVLYKETISNKVEGVGHYEPLRHYAEVHLILEPLPRGSGLVFGSCCSEDILDRNWQRLVMGHLSEKKHLGVLTGSPITDMKITLASGRAHIKHTEGGDFRQSTYRAVRQGLMRAQSVLLEPYYSFRIEVPSEQIGRVINDIRMRKGTMNRPEDLGGVSLITGKAPVVQMNGYASEVAAYTGGKGRVFYELAGYDECTETEKVVNEKNYNPESDLENSPDSIFCAHGSGFPVKWDQVPQYMHLESCLKKESEKEVRRRNFSIDDKELEAIMEREFGKVEYNLYRPKPVYKEEERVAVPVVRKQYVIVDGYNLIFAWDELNSIAKDSLESARERLMNILSNYSAFTHINVILVFDAYRVPGGKGERFEYHNIHVVYTKEHQYGDNYIEMLVAEIGKNEYVRVVTSDRLIQLSAIRSGVLRTSSREFIGEINNVEGQIANVLSDLEKQTPKTTIGGMLKIE